MPSIVSVPARSFALLLTAIFLLAASAAPVLAAPKTVLVAGDIAWDGAGSGAELTARVVERNEGKVITAGDNAYQSATLQEFRDYYEPTWGRFLKRTRATPGNHDYYTSGARGYFSYFGWRAGPDRRGFYSLKVGNWRIYALDSEVCETKVGCKAGSPQYKWLKKQLAQHNASCSMAVWHTPRYSSGFHGNESAVAPLYKLLYEAGAELVVNGHEHSYERLAPARPSGRIDWKKGVQQIIVGTGGAPLRGKGGKTAAHSRVFSDDAWGVLRLRLRKDSYAWKFLPVDGETFTDKGERRCHGKP